MPTPVPASTSHWPPSENARATASAISTCCGRSSKTVESALGGGEGGTHLLGSHRLGRLATLEGGRRLPALGERRRDGLARVDVLAGDLARQQGILCGNEAGEEQPPLPRKGGRPAPQRREHGGRRLRVGKSAVRDRGFDAERSRELPEATVRMTGHHQSREPARVVGRHGESNACTLEVGEIEGDVLTDERPVADERADRGCDRLERGRSADRLVRDARQLFDEARYLAAGIHEPLEGLEDVPRLVEPHRADLGDAVALRVEPRRLQVERDVGSRRIEHVCEAYQKRQEGTGGRRSYYPIVNGR